MRSACVPAWGDSQRGLPLPVVFPTLTAFGTTPGMPTLIYLPPVCLPVIRQAAGLDLGSSRI